MFMIEQLKTIKSLNQFENIRKVRIMVAERTARSDQIPLLKYPRS